MTANLRKALFAAIPIVVSAIAAWGYTSQAQAALLGTTLTTTVGFAWALSRATGNRLLDAGVRRALYALIIATIATAGGWATFDVALVTSIALAVVGAILAIWNVDPDEQTSHGAGLGILDEQRADRRGDESPRRALRMAGLFAALILAGLAATAQPAEAKIPAPVSKQVTLPPAVQWGEMYQRQLTVSGGRTPTKCWFRAWQEGPTKLWIHVGKTTCMGPVMNRWAQRVRLTCYSPLTGTNFFRYGRWAHASYDPSYVACNAIEVATVVRVQFRRQ